MSVNWTRNEPINGLAMPMGVVAPTILEEYSLIFFGSRAQAAIYITSHGFAPDAQTFTPPVACQFYVGHGGNLTYHVRNFPLFHGTAPAGNLHAAATANCQDYKLTKYQGLHSADVMSPETYAKIAQKASQHNATFVTIRNRLTGAQRLSSVVARIVANCPNVTTIHCLFCRETTPKLSPDVSACPNTCFLCGG